MKFTVQQQLQLNHGLFNAAQKGDLKRMEELLRRGAMVNARDLRKQSWSENRQGLTPLFIGIETKSLPTVRFLISHGADVNAVVDATDLAGEKDGRYPKQFSGEISPLDAATRLDALEIVKLLKQKGAKSNPDDHINFNGDVRDLPFMGRIAASYNALKVMDWFLNAETKSSGKEWGVEEASYLLQWAVSNQNVEMVNLLVSRGADRKSCHKGVLEATSRRYLDTAMALVSHADLGADENGNTPLINLLTGLLPEYIQLSDIPSVDPTQLTPEQLKVCKELLVKNAAERKKIVAFIQAAVKNGAAPDAVAPSGKTPLLLVVEQLNFSFVKALLDSGADPNLTARGSTSPLRLLACQNGHQPVDWEMVKQVNPSFTAEQIKNLRTQLERSDAKGLTLARLLLDKGANVRTGDNRFALGEAAWRGNSILIQLLLDHGADPNTPFSLWEGNMLLLEDSLDIPLEGLEEKTGEKKKYTEVETSGEAKALQTPLCLAARQGHVAVVTMLLEAGAKSDAVDMEGNNALHNLANSDIISSSSSAKVRFIDVNTIQDGRFAAASFPILEEESTTQNLKLLTRWATARYVAIAKDLLARGCSPDTPNYENITPLQIAICRSELPIISAMFEASKQPPTAAEIFWVIQNSRRQRMASLVLNRLQYDLTKNDEDNRPAPGNAKKWEKELSVRWKIQHAKALARRKDYLPHKGNEDAAVITYLLHKGANPNDVNNAGLTPLMLAARTGQIEVVHALIIGGAQVNATNGNGESIVTQVKKYGQGQLNDLPYPEVAGPNREHWLQPKFIEARKAQIRQLLLADDAKIIDLLKQSGAN